jgi:hypothetical protein
MNIYKHYKHAPSGCSIIRDKKKKLNAVLLVMVIAGIAFLNFLLYKLTAV